PLSLQQPAFLPRTKERSFPELSPFPNASSTSLKRHPKLVYFPRNVFSMAAHAPSSDLRYLAFSRRPSSSPVTFASDISSPPHVLPIAPVRNGTGPLEKCQFRRFLTPSITHPFQSIRKSKIFQEFSSPS
ncbi:hypothetical protein AABB24_005375, partial [Solanum stoloniferum]